MVVENLLILYSGNGSWNSVAYVLFHCILFREVIDLFAFVLLLVLRCCGKDWRAYCMKEYKIANWIETWSAILDSRELPEGSRIDPEVAIERGQFGWWLYFAYTKVFMQTICYMLLIRIKFSDRGRFNSCLWFVHCFGCDLKMELIQMLNIEKEHSCYFLPVHRCLQCFGY